MKKNILYVILGLMGLMGTLSIGVVNAGNHVTTVPGLVVTGEQDGQIFEYGVLKFDDGSGHIIMLLDRNLGATMTGAGTNANTGSYGFKYQRGNNYGFADGCWTNGCSDSVNENATGTFAIWNPNYDNSNYSGDTFIKGDYNHGNDYWSDSTNNSGNHVDLWGGGTDNQNNNWGIETMTAENIVNRQGPCPEGYHVPSIGERNNLFIYWYNANNGGDLSISVLQKLSEENIGTDFVKAFNISFAGVRTSIGIYNQNLFSILWSSSPNVDGYPSYFWDFFIDNNTFRINGGNGPVAGQSLRCFYNYYLFPYKYSFIDGDIELESGSIISGEKLVDIINLSELNTTKEGYEFNYWYIQGAGDTEFDFTGTVITGDIEFYAKRKPIGYTITYELDGGINSENNPEKYTIETAIITFENPTKDGYTFDGWFSDANFTTGIASIPVGSTGDRTLYAKWTKTETKPSGGYSGGGGGSSASKSDTNKSNEQPAGNQVDSSEQTPQNDKNTENVIQSETKGSEESSNTPMDSSAKASEGQEILSPSDSSFTKEQKDAYTFAHEKGITTMPTIQEAQMDGKLTRIAMAKMLSQYAMNVLGQKPANIVTPKFNDVTDKQNSDYDGGVTLSYQLGIMGQNMPNNKFRPNDEVTRAEFATALSRMIYNTSDGEYKSTPKYYIHHMEKLVKEGIITKDDPNMKELRGYVMIMLMRSAI